MEGAAPPWLRRHHTKFHGWTEPEAAVVLGRPEQDDQGDILRVRGAEKRVHQALPIPFAWWSGRTPIGPTATTESKPTFARLAVT